jgi:hypothetical protein
VDAVLSRHADAIARTTIASLLVQPRKAETVSPAEMTVQDDVEVGFTILDLSGKYELDDLD